MKSIVYSIKSKIWKLQGRLDTWWTRYRFRKKKNTHIPFYDRKKDVYRIFFEDRYDESGSIEYVVGEYIRGGLIYHFKTSAEYVWDGKNYRLVFGKKEHVDHEHSFRAVLCTIAEYGGGSFSIEGFEHEYSEQEREMIRQYLEELKCDKTKGCCEMKGGTRWR